ncbi:4Fe-4S ferredoxin [Methanosarcina sp. 2.H.T.1A.6]|uniref:methanogenesis marker 16 metalloprotein n=1 Tax=unclassified Methanosarcina TaxID=2644672 RepID=UPI000622175D|nr:MULTISPECIES: methanogenesis marker 16 metalloprotein [unclassified Methanosarcina]KKG13868.1 4Fe-4S ferredoxin [Methanosarcina sp. 2.H.T.1A.3]KKG21680.1 4Fe-4S ferredoxin [Methanosarcina sp. 2.H.T.1A.8]KKG24190.1 4Fe-4S ferredoxin [Methanosarcina sp. 2.H.T.1A.15]KKG25059.1 4Fe-4S ferredoxin [Methanosarcina sp. 2.H.T.1A.6]
MNGAPDNTDKCRTIPEIQAKIDTGEAVVLTAEEISARVKAGEEIRLEDIDVVTTATRGIMSGTYAVLSFKVSEPDSFVRASKVLLNGVPAVVGPCPNERLGVLDLIVLGTAHSETDSRYGGGHLLRELVEGQSIPVDVTTSGGDRFSVETGLSEMPFARLYATRHAFKNYRAFVNPGKEPIKTIFHALPFDGEFREMTFCGCGELNPIQNDPKLETIGIGTRVLINGAEGFVTGQGTRSTPDNPNLAGFADLHDMTPEYMGGFATSAGPEIINTWAVPIPVLSQGMLENILKLDSQIPLKLVDLAGRIPLCEITYGDVWDNTDLNVKYEPEKCIDCKVCCVAEACPMGAVSKGENGVVHDPELCFNCGLCISRCRGEAFSANLGTVSCTTGGCLRDIKVTLRQSDRARAVKAAQELKEQVLSGKFRIKEPVEKISWRE